MKYFLLAIILLGAASFSNAQTTAEDFTKTDCESVEYNLFDALDTGSVVVMEIVMLDGCLPCITAAHLMEPVIDEYNLNYENRILWFTMGYNDSYSCDELIAWKNANEIGCDAQFVEGADQAEYYGGVGMPTIIIIGRNTHQVYYIKFGFIPSDTVEFAEALDYALGIADPLTVNSLFQGNLNIYPNPVIDHIEFNQSFQAGSVARIYNSTGKLTLEKIIKGNSLDLSQLSAGNYFLSISENNAAFSGYFIKL